MQNYHQPLLPSETYHLFNRAIGNEKLFIEPKNYIFFLDKLNTYTHGVAQVYTYSFLPNHFHLVVKIKAEDDIIHEYKRVKKKEFDPLKIEISDFIMERFSNFLNSYTKSFNKVYNRKGALFLDYLKRSKVEKESDFTSFIFYVHKNAVHHQYVTKIGEYKYDAFNSLISNKPTKLLRQEVLDWFGGLDRFIAFHKQPIEIKSIEFIDI